MMAVNSFFIGDLASFQMVACGLPTPASRIQDGPSAQIETGSFSIPVEEGATLTIGRTAGCDLRIREDGVSRAHCRLEQRSGDTDRRSAPSSCESPPDPNATQRL
jgi:hypothetical protein